MVNFYHHRDLFVVEIILPLFKPLEFPFVYFPSFIEFYLSPSFWEISYCEPFIVSIFKLQKNIKIKFYFNNGWVSIGVK